MSYLVLARKSRPQDFNQVVGQAPVVKTLKNSIVRDRIAHAILFSGVRGVGKTTLARIMAKAINCEQRTDGNPCNKCQSCTEITAGSSLDLYEIDGASNRGIQEIRELKEKIRFLPTSSKYKIIIIDEVHMLTTESFNALLKTLEEPPEHAIFIFATTDVHKVPLTIISRCQRFDFRRIELDAIKNQLAKIATADNISISDSGLTFIAKKADGALRDAQSLVHQVISFGGKKIDSSIVSKMLNLIDEDIYFKISDAILNKDFLEAFEISKIIYDNGWNYIDFLAGLLEHFRNILTTVLKQDTSFVESSEQVKKMYLEYMNTFSESDILRILTYLSKVERELKISQNQKLLMEISLSHLIGLESTTTISELVKNIQGGKFPEQSEKKNYSREIVEKIVKKENSHDKQVEETTSVKKDKTSDSAKSEVSNISNVDANISTEESSIINAIINELGGREFK